MKFSFLYVDTLAFRMTPDEDDLGEFTHLKAIELWEKMPSPFIVKLKNKKIAKESAADGQ